MPEFNKEVRDISKLKKKLFMLSVEVIDMQYSATLVCCSFHYSALEKFPNTNKSLLKVT